MARSVIFSVCVVVSLFSKQSVAEGTEAPAVTQVSETAEPFFKPKITGFLDGFVQHTFESPRPSMRVFDGSSDTVDVALAQVDLQAELGHRLLVRLELIAGSSTLILNGSTVPTGTDPILGTILRSIQQVNVGVKLPWHDLIIDAGKFMAVAGYESFESKENFNYSRAFLYGYATPFTVTGVRATMPVLIPELTAQAALLTGTDIVFDNNPHKTFGFNTLAGLIINL